MRERERYWRRLTRAAWQLVVPAVLGQALGAEGIWAAGLAALGPGMGCGAARARSLRESQWWGAAVEGVASAVLASLVATVSALAGMPGLMFWLSVAGLRLLLAAPGRSGPQSAREFRPSHQLGRLTCWNPATGV